MKLFKQILLFLLVAVGTKILAIKERRAHESSQSQMVDNRVSRVINDGRLMMQEKITQLESLITDKIIDANTMVDTSGNTLLHWAAEQNDTDFMNFLLQQGASVIASNNQGERPLIKALQANFYNSSVNGASDYATAELLIDRGTPVNIYDKDGWTPLHFIVGDPYLDQTVQMRLIQKLLDRGASVEAKTFKGESVISFASGDNFIPTTQVLCEKLGISPLVWAIENNNINLLEALLRYESYTNEELRQAINSRNSQEETALLMACRTQEYDLALQLITLGADVNAADLLGMTPLHYISQEHSLHNSPILRQLLTTLIQGGANIYAEDITGLTPIAIAQGPYQEQTIGYFNLPQQNFSDLQYVPSYDLIEGLDIPNTTDDMDIS